MHHSGAQLGLHPHDGHLDALRVGASEFFFGDIFLSSRHERAGIVQQSLTVFNWKFVEGTSAAIGDGMNGPAACCPMIRVPALHYIPESL